MKLPRWIWAVLRVTHRTFRGHWPVYVLLDRQLECLACYRGPGSSRLIWGGV